MSRRWLGSERRWATAEMDATRLYLSEIGSSKLLTAEEEILMVQIVEWNKL